MRSGYPADRGASYSSGQKKKTAKQETEVLKRLREATKRGDASAQFKLGLMHTQGEGVPRNYAGGARWWRNAVEQGDTVAQYFPGDVYLEGQGGAEGLH